MQLRVGLVGCGEVADEKHLPALLQIPEIAVVSFFDKDSQRADKLAARVPGATAASRLEELLAREDVAAIGVLTSPASHAEIAEKALLAGKHVLVEKPMVLDLAEARRLQRLSQQSPKQLMVGFHMRWHRLVRKAARLLQQGAIGQVQGVRFAWCSPRPPRPSEWKDRRASGGGSLVELGVHHFDLIHHLLGSPFRQVLARSLSPLRPDETASVLGVLSNGVSCSATLSEVSTHKIELEFHGTLGRLTVDCLRFDGLQLLPWGVDPGSIPSRLRSLWGTLRSLPTGLRQAGQGGDYRLSYREQWRTFANCIATGKPVDCNASAGLAATAAVQAAVKSLEGSAFEPVE